MPINNKVSFGCERKAKFPMIAMDFISSVFESTSRLCLFRMSCISVLFIMLNITIATNPPDGNSALKSTSACYGSDAMCNRYHMECSGAQRIEVGTLWYGTKPGLIQCQQGISDCKMKMGAAYNECCSFNASDILTKFSPEHKAKVMQECQGRSACHGQAPRLITQPYSSYVWMQYSCVQDSNLVQMCKQFAAAGSDLFLTFNITQGYQFPTIHGSRDCNCRITTDTWHTRLQTSFVNREFKRPGGPGSSECSSAVLHDSSLNSSYSCFGGSSRSTWFEFLDRDKELSLKHLFINGTDDRPGLLLLHFSVSDSAKICLECFPPGTEVPPTSSCSSMHFSSQQPLSAAPSTSSPLSASLSLSEIQPTVTSPTTIVSPASVPSSSTSTSTKTGMTPSPTAVTTKPVTLWPSSSVATTTTITTTTLAPLTKPTSLLTTTVLSSSASSAAFKSTTPVEMTSILNSTPVFTSSPNPSGSPSVSAFVNITSSDITQTSALTPKSVTLNPDRSLSTHFVTSIVDENNNTLLNSFHTTNSKSQSSYKNLTVATTTFKSFPNYYTNTTDTRNLSTKPDVSTQSGPVDPPDDDEVGNRGMVIGVTIGTVLAVILLAAILMMCFCIRLKRKEHVRKNYIRNTNIFYSFPEESDTGSTHSETTRELRERDWHTHPEFGRKTLYESVETPSSSLNENYNAKARNSDLTISGNAHSPLTSRMSDVTYSSDTSNDTIEFYNATEPVTGENAQDVDHLSNGKSVTFDPMMLYTQVVKEGRTQF